MGLSGPVGPITARVCLLKQMSWNKRFFFAALLGLVTFLAASPCSAIPFYDLDEINRRLNASGSPSDRFHSDTFNILENGFVVGQHEVTAAFITFWLADDGDSQGEAFNINLSDILSTSQYATFLLVGTTEVGVNLLATLNQEGILNYTVTATSGDFWLKKALLAATANEISGSQGGGNPVPVPDLGSTLLLAGLGIGLLIVGHRARIRC